MSDQITAEELAGVKIFSALSAEALAEIADVCRPARYEVDETIISSRDGNHDVFFLLHGQARVVNHTMLGDMVGYGELSEGSYFGELSAIDGGPRSAEVEAVTLCSVAALSPDDFRRTLGRHPDVLFAVMRNLAAMIRRTNLTVLSHATL